MRHDVILKRTVSALTKAGKEVSVLLPPLLLGREKTDLNDVLQAQGLPGVARVLQDDLYYCKMTSTSAE